MSKKFRHVLCQKWAVEILELLSTQTTLNYMQIEAEFDTSSDIISNRLDELGDAGLLKRREKSARNVQYSISEDGKEVVSLVEEIDQIIE